jgi:MFS family permease
LARVTELAEATAADVELHRYGASATPVRARGAHVGRHRQSREYRGVLFAQFTSECGDQIGAIAISLLVYSRSNSAFLAAASYAVTYVPMILASVLLAPLVDRLPRRQVMIVCDVGRAILMGLLVLLTRIHGVPILVLLAVVLASSFLSPPFSAARTALIPDIFGSGTVYIRAVAKGRILQQFDTVLGFALGGLIVAAISTSGALIVDTGSFVLSAFVVLGSVTVRPAAIPGPFPAMRSILRDLGPGFRDVLSVPVRRALFALGTLSVMFLIAPEALAVAYSRQHGGGAVAAGFLSAAQPTGIAVGAWLLVKYVPLRAQLKALLPSAALCAVVLTATCLVSSVPATVVLWVASGLPMCFVVTTIGVYNSVSDRASRGRAIGLAMAGIAVTQGLGFLLWGAIGSWRDASTGVTWAGIFGLALVAFLWSRWPHQEIAAAAD